jgi:hypothetical protein
VGAQYWKASRRFTFRVNLLIQTITKALLYLVPRALLKQFLCDKKEIVV